MKQIFNREKGVTLIELIIVVIVVGLLAIVGAKSFSNSGVSDNARAQALFEGSTKLSQNAVLLAQAAGTSSAVASSTLPLAGNTLMDVLIGGNAYMSASFPSAFAQSGISAMTDVAQGTPGGGSYTIATYTVTMTGGGTAPHRFAFAQVPDAVVQALVTKYGSGNTIAAAADTTNASVQYTVATAGTRTVYIFKQL